MFRLCGRADPEALPAQPQHPATTTQIRVTAADKQEVRHAVFPVSVHSVPSPQPPSAHSLPLPGVGPAGAAPLVAAASAVNLRLWNIHPEGYPVTVALNSFAEDVRAGPAAASTCGFSNAVLGDQPKAVSMLKAVSWIWANSAGAADRGSAQHEGHHAAVLFRTPITCSATWTAQWVTNSRSASAAGFVVIGWVRRRCALVLLRRQAGQGPRDFAGLRIRVQAPKSSKEMITLLGATPTMVPYKGM